MMSTNSYIPKIDDYVQWSRGVEGWVYFKDIKYITIEANVRPKDCDNYKACCLHRNDRLLIVCYRDQWKDLVYVKSRESKNE